jgi:hypothetical protein
MSSYQEKACALSSACLCLPAACGRWPAAASAALGTWGQPDLGRCSVHGAAAVPSKYLLPGGSSSRLAGLTIAGGGGVQRRCRNRFLRGNPDG